VNLDLDPTQTLLRDTVRDYLAAEVPFDRIRELDREQRWDEALWKGMARQGWLGLPFPESLGGAGGSLVDAGLLIEELAQRAAVVPLLEGLTAGLVCARNASSGRAGEVVASLLDGGAVPVPALLERSDTIGKVELEVSGGVLCGEKLFVDYGQFATHHLVAARDGGEPALFWVDARHESVAAEPLRTIGRTPSARVSYRGTPAERIAGADALLEMVSMARTFAAVQCLGAAQRALDMTVAYAGVREAFGRPIGSFQAVKHHAANMATRVAASRFLVYEALHALSRGASSPRQVAFAKASASRMVPEVTMLAHQIHGGNGVIEENDLYFFTLRGKERSLAWGSAEECLCEAAERVGDPQDWLV
jgi:alkylation response protein AidB-like acyl-CoA dehydrogenase